MTFNYCEEAVNDYEKLLESGEGHDVIICVGEYESYRELHAHSNILRARSSYFRAAISNEWVEKNEGKFIIRKPTVSPYLFKIILR